MMTHLRTCLREGWKKSLQCLVIHCFIHFMSFILVVLIVVVGGTVSLVPVTHFQQGGKSFLVV